MMNFPFGTNGKFIILGVPILKHIRVTFIVYCQAQEASHRFQYLSGNFLSFSPLNF